MAIAVRHAPTRNLDVRLLADQAFSRAAGAPLVAGNAVRLLCDACGNYPAWLDTIGRAQRHIHLEMYIVHEDVVGERFAAALAEKARAGVAVRLLYDWMGAFGKTSRRFWNRLRGAGVEVRCYNPPRLDDPLGWLSRDHRKCLVVDGEVAFVSGLCVGRAWEGDPARGVAPWRDTGVEVRGPAVADIARTFADSWDACGAPLPAEELAMEAPAPAGDVALRVVATSPGTSGLFRVDQLVAALARRNLWLTDAYYAGTTPTCRPCARRRLDAVDVRLLVPGRGNDIPLMQAIARTRLPRAARGGRARLRVERAHDPRQDGGGGRPLGACGVHQPEPGELARQPGAGRDRGGRGVRALDGGAVRARPRRRDRGGPGAEEGARGGQRAAPRAPRARAAARTARPPAR